MNWLRSRVQGKTAASSSSAAASEAETYGNAPLLDNGAVVGGQVSQDGVVTGRPVQDDDASPEQAERPTNVSSSPAATETVTGRIVALPDGSNPALAPRGLKKQVLCANCNASNAVDVAVMELLCGACGTHLRAGHQPPLAVICFSCNTKNLVPANSLRIQCGSCQTPQDIPGEEAARRRAELEAREEEDVAKALEKSMKDY
eukprot:TRINITY_DN17914_c0_g1_i2.p1 TRINITY_DN17914_c0_g1~~TRINITY_DN17914_c0_g1_i2.p1  ORF type:complete len:202 (+),score=40.78 TRINITY_DN17914_c0_g1_i2:81-686(+)